jgi:hypothetical protein
MDVLSPIEETYQNNNLFYFPEAYERLENIVKTYPADRLNLLNTNTEFLIKSTYVSWNNFNMSCWVNILKGIIVHINIQV